MQDLTNGSIPKHLVRMAIPMAIGMFVQALFVVIDLYFVGQLGEKSLAGVSAAGNLSMLVLALTQILNVGAGTLIAHAIGRQDKHDATAIFNQALLISIGMFVLTLLLGYSLANAYMGVMSQDTAVLVQGSVYLYWFMPNLALQFALVAMSAAMRGAGVVKPAMQVQLLSVVINIILTPILIHGWFTGYPMGVKGAGLASSLSMLFAVCMLWRYFMRWDHYITVKAKYWSFDLGSLKRLLYIGLPSGGEFFLMFAYMALVFWSIQDFGASATAGFGLGSKVMQSLFLPAMAVAFALPAIAGQNFGAKNATRVKESFLWSVGMSSALMATLVPICLWYSQPITNLFTNDTAVLTVATGFLAIICFNFVPTGINFCCSGVFQGMGNTWPGLIGTATRLLSFAIPLIWLKNQDSFVINQVWKLSVATVLVQLTLALFFVKKEFKQRLTFE